MSKFLKIANILLTVFWILWGIAILITNSVTNIQFAIVWLLYILYRIIELLEG